MTLAKRNLDSRADLLNVTSTLMSGNRSTPVDSANAGTARSTGKERNIQLALKFNF